MAQSRVRDPITNCNYRGGNSFKKFNFSYNMKKGRKAYEAHSVTFQLVHDQEYKLVDCNFENGLAVKNISRFS